MKVYPLNPLAVRAAMLGMSRPLEASDFPHGHIPSAFSRPLRPNFFNRLRQSMRYLTVQELGMANLNMGEGAVPQDTWSTNVVTTTQRLPLGTVALSKDGRVFRYASAGATDLVAGNIIQSAAPIANHLALTSAAQAIGDGRGQLGPGGVLSAPIAVTPGATAGAANLYAEGTLCIDTTPGNGYNYRISGHAAITSSTLFNLYLDPDELIQVALTSSSRYGLHHNPYRQTIVSATTATALTVGGAVAIITGNGTSENYGWIQTRGPFPALINGTPGVGIGVVISATTAGAVDVAAVAAEINVRIIGRMMQVGVSTKNNSVFLMLD